MGVFYRKTQTRITTVDGWGNLTTPYGSFPALRLRLKFMAKDSIAYDTLAFAIDRPKQTVIKWLGKNQAVPLLEVNTLEIGGQSVPVLISYKDSLREDAPVAIKDERQQSQLVKMYPNPASNEIQLSLNAYNGKKLKVELWTLEGKKVWEKDMQSKELRIPVAQFPPAVYIVRVFTDTQVQSGKLIIKR